MKLEFWFEFGSTYSYPTAMRIEQIAAENGVELRWCPFLLGPIFNAQGWDDSPFNVYPAKGRYMWKDLERICALQQIAFKKPAIFPQNGLHAARIACRFSEETWLPEFVRSVYIANFEKDLDISDRAVLAHCLPMAAEESEFILAESESKSSKQLLRENTTRAQTLGIFGAPSFVLGNNLFWGNDRLEMAIDCSLDGSQQ